MNLSHLTSRLRAEVASLAADNDLPGGAVSVRQGGEEIFAEGFGFCDAARTLAVTADTMFGVASVTKIVTAILILHAQEQQRLSLSDPVSRHFPDLHCARDNRMRLYHLLCHSAGFPGLPFRHRATIGDHSGDRMVSAADLVAGFNALKPALQAPPGEQVNYSNESFCLLGGLIETLHDSGFAAAAERFVFRPLNMTRSVIQSDPGGQGNVAHPLVLTARGLRDCGFWNAPLFFPAGGMVTSARDMTRLISALHGQSDVLTPDSVSEMLSRSTPVASRPQGNARYGLGLELTELDATHRLVWHTGQRPGISSFVGHMVPTGLSVAFVTNIADAPAARIGHRLMASALQDTLLPDACQWPPRGARHAPNDPARFSGRFGSSEIGDFRVTLDRARLWIDLPTGPCAFSFHGPAHGIVAEQSFCFLGADGAVCATGQPKALALDLRVLPRLNAV